MAMAFAANRWGFYATRFMIGAAEAGSSPACSSISRCGFPSGWRARITSLFAIGVPVSGVVAAPASSWIMTHMAGVADLRGWQWLFLIEGAPAVGLGVVAYFVLPDRPAAARSFRPTKRRGSQRDLEDDDAAEAACGTFAQALRSPRTYVLRSSISPSMRPRASSCCGFRPCCATPAFATSAKSAGARR